MRLRQKNRFKVERAMSEGAIGLSTFLVTPPSSLLTTAQLIELAKVAAGHGESNPRTYAMTAWSFFAPLQRPSTPARGPDGGKPQQRLISHGSGRNTMPMRTNGSCQSTWLRNRDPFSAEQDQI